MFPRHLPPNCPKSWFEMAIDWPRKSNPSTLSNSHLLLPWKCPMLCPPHHQLMALLLISQRKQAIRVTRTILTNKYLYPNTSHASHLFHLCTYWVTIPANLLSFLNGDSFLYEFFFFGQYLLFPVPKHSNLVFQSPRMSISACDITYASHDKVLLNGGTG